MQHDLLFWAHDTFSSVEENKINLIIFSSSKIKDSLPINVIYKFTFLFLCKSKSVYIVISKKPLRSLDFPQCPLLLPDNFQATLVSLRRNYIWTACTLHANTG